VFVFTRVNPHHLSIALHEVSYWRYLLNVLLFLQSVVIAQMDATNVHLWGELEDPSFAVPLDGIRDVHDKIHETLHQV
jgi:hypothetical protein